MSHMPRRSAAPVNERDLFTTVRLLENWLPLAEDTNRLHGWGYQAAELERLVMAAAPDLLRANNVLEARFILLHHHVQNEAT